MVLRTLLSITYAVAFLVLHNYVTNTLVGKSNFNYAITSNAVQFAIASLVYKRIFENKKTLFPGFYLFAAVILTTIFFAWLASDKQFSGIFFPEYFPFYLGINTLIVWAIFRCKSNRYLAIVTIIIAVIVADFVVLPKSYKDKNELAVEGFLGQTVVRLNYIDIYKHIYEVPRKQSKYSILFISYIECPPCRLMEPFMNDVCSRLKSFEVDVFKINPINHFARIKQIEGQKTSPGCITTLLPQSSESFKQTINYDGLPLMLIIDGSGKILYAHSGYHPQERASLLKTTNMLIKK
jgi:hypothetical protein